MGKSLELDYIFVIYVKNCVEKEEKSYIYEYLIFVVWVFVNDFYYIRWCLILCLENFK